VNAILIDSFGCFSIAMNLREIDEMLGLAADVLTKGRVVVGSQTVTEDLHLGPIVQAWDGLHEVAGGVIAEVGADVTDPEAAVWRQLPRERERRLVQNRDLLETQLRVAVANSLPLVVGEWVQHGMVRVYRGKTVLLQLVGHDAHQRLLTSRIVRPVANDLDSHIIGDQ